MTTSRLRIKLVLLCSAAIVAGVWTGCASAFSFSEEEEKLNQEIAREQQKVDSEIRRNLDTECPVSLADQRVLLLVSESYFRESYPYSQIFRQQTGLYTPINRALGKLGFRTYTEKQITAQIAEAELRAVANGDLDAATDAASKLAANYLLYARVDSRSGRNPVIGVKEVSVNVSLSLQSAKGEPVSHTAAHAESFSSEDARSTAVTLVREQADRMAARLYRDICKFASKNRGPEDSK